DPNPERPARPLAMQLTDSLDQRSPQRLVVTLLGATSHMILARRSARSVTLPSCSPILNPMPLRSVRMAWPGSYMPAPVVMTQPRHRSRPAAAAPRPSLVPFLNSTMIPSGFFTHERPRASAHSVS